MASWRAPGLILEAPDSILEAPGLDFGDPGPRFWRVLGTIFRIFDRFWVRFFEVVALQPKCQECQKSQGRRERPACTNPSLQRLEPSVGGRRCPPQGVFNRIIPKSMFPKTSKFPKHFFSDFQLLENTSLPK